MRTSSVEDQAESSFWHALVRDVAYGQIPRAERAAKHLAVAEWIESAVGERMTDHAEVLAYHYERAIELSAAAGREAGADLRTKAAGALQMAGERALQLDVAKAVSFYRRAEALLPPDDPDFPVLHVRTLAAALDLGETPQAEMEAAYEGAIEDLRARGEELAAAEMFTRYGRFLKGVGSTERAERASDEAIDLLEPLGPSPQLTEAYAARAGNPAPAAIAKYTLCGLSIRYCESATARKYGSVWMYRGKMSG